MLLAQARNERRLEGGFSFIELVVVILILGILGAIVTPNLLRWRDQAKEKATITNLKVLDQAISSYQLLTNQWPAKLDNLVVKPASITQQQWKGPYLKEGQEVPLDSWGQEFIYKVLPKDTTPPYELYSWGSKGEGSESDEWIRG